MDLWTIMLVGCFAFVLAGTIKGLVGIGLPTAAIALMTLVLDPRTAISLILFPMIGANLWQLIRAGQIGQTARRYAVFATILFIGVAVTAFASSGAGDRILLGLLGIVILIFVAFNFKGWVPAIPARHDQTAQVIFGLITGFVGGLTAGWAAPLAMYLTSKRIEKDEFVRATGFLIFVGSLPLCAAYIQLGFMTGPLAGVSAAMLIPTMIGFASGEFLRSRLSVRGFRNIILIVFVLLGLNLLRRAIWYV